MKTIALEEHYISPGYVDSHDRNFKEDARRGGDRMAKVLEQLPDLDKKRIALMDEAGIDMQVLSINSPGAEQLEAPEAIKFARDTNDFLADAVKKYPNRFAGFATLTTDAPDKAVQELELMVQKHGFQGAVINGHIKGRYLDDRFFWPILECAEKLNVPIYIHPTPPPQPVIDTYYGGFSPEVIRMLAGPGWGWHIETAVHVIRLIISGAFDKYPKLQIIIGHLGEGLPFMFERIDSRMSPKLTGLNRTMSQDMMEIINRIGLEFQPIPISSATNDGFSDLYAQLMMTFTDGGKFTP